MIFKVAKVIDSCTVIINAGKNHKISENQRFMIVAPNGEEVFDPDTNESLGFLERVIGTGRVSRVFDKMAEIKTDMTYEYNFITAAFDKYKLVRDEKTQQMRSPIAGDKVPRPFDHPEIGNIAKPIP